MIKSNQDRRQFIKCALLGAAAVPVLGGLFPRTANAADLPALTEADPTAAALGYVEDANTVKKDKYPTHAAGQACANCNLAQAAQGDGRMPCTLYPGKSVNAKGWCAAYVKKA
jgi:hypothetical protein